MVGQLAEADAERREMRGLTHDLPQHSPSARSIGLLENDAERVGLMRDAEDMEHRDAVA